MMNRLSSLLFYLLVVIPAAGQSVSRQEADSLLRVLHKTKPGIDRIDLLLRLAQFHIFKPGENQVDFDSATSYIATAERLNQSVQSPTCYGYQLLTSSFMAREKGQREAAKGMVEKAIGLLEPGNNKDYLGKAYYELSNYYEYKDPQQFPQKVRLVEQSVAAYREAGNKEERAFGMKMLGDLYSIGGDYDKAIAVLEQALAVYDSIHYKPLQGVYDLLGSIYRVKNNYKLAIEYELKALKAAELTHDTTMQLCQINNNLGTLYSEVHRKDLAVKYFQDALKTAITFKDVAAVVLIAYNISIRYHLLNQPQQALDLLAAIPEELLQPTAPSDRSLVAMSYLISYLDLKQYGEASSYSILLSKLAIDPAISDYRRNTINYWLALYYLKTGQFAKARFKLAINAPLSKKLAEPVRIMGDYHLLYRLDSAERKYESAFYHLLAYKTMSDSVFNEAKSKQVKQLEVEYETAKKADSIQLKDRDILLLKQTNDLQQANLEQADLIKNITIAGIVLAAAIIGLLYRQYRNKQQSNQVISGKNEQLQHLLTEKEWLLKEVHHRVKNNLQTVVSLLELQPDSLQNEALSAIRDSRNRIYAMSLIHQKLYQSESIASVNMRSYLLELVNHLQEMYSIENTIRMYVQVAPVDLDVSQAIPVGLIVNEAVTNCIKYAFNSSHLHPEITVLLAQDTRRQLELVVEDNGTGIPAPVEAPNKNGFGLKLMQGLAEDIDGKLVIASGNGTRISVCFQANIPLHELGAETAPEKAIIV